MELVALNCNNCGSKLKVAESAKFVTCKHCDTQLAIHHNDGASFTELAEAASRMEESAKEIEAHADAMSGQTDVLVLQNDLERLDREWATERDALMVKGKNGHQHVPTIGQAYAAFFLAPVFFIAGVVLYSVNGSPIMLGFGLVGVVFGAIGFSTLNNAKAYRAAEARYEAAREEIGQQLEQARRSSKRRGKRADEDEAGGGPGAEAEDEDAN